MTSADDKRREQQALDALIAAALRQENEDAVEFGDLAAYEQALSDEDLDALSQLPDDLAARIVAGEIEPEASDSGQPLEEQLLADMQFASGLNADDADDQRPGEAQDEKEPRIEESNPAEGEAGRGQDEPDGPAGPPQPA